MGPTPETPKEPSKSPGPALRYCGLGNHHLQLPHKTISDPNMLKFAKKLNNELRSRTLICGICLELLQGVYKEKVNNAISHHKKRQQTKGNSISDVSSSQRPETSDSSESQGHSLMYHQRPETMARLQANVNMRNRRADELPSSTTSDTTEADRQRATTAAPTTSTAAAAALAALRAAAQRQQQQPRASSAAEQLSQASNNTAEDDDEPLLSLNAVNGTRMPHIQPIPKRRQIQLSGPQLDIYLAGTTGG